MTTFWNTKFTKRDYECTNIVAIKAEKLPKGYDPEIWKANGMEVREGIELMRNDITHQGGERHERYGYL
jgi:hypothetical protein